MNFKNKFLSHFIGDNAAFEKSTLEDWKKDAESNISELKNIMGYPTEMDLLQNYQDVNQKKAWENIQNRTNITDKQPFAFDIKKIAAILVILIAGIWGIAYLSNTHSKFNEYAGATSPIIKYSDGSVINMDQSAALTEKGYRSFALQGRAYFDVAKDAKNAFVVQLQHGTLEVLGTEFNINTTTQKTEIWVSEGRVKVNFKNQEYILTANELLVIDEQKIMKSINAVAAPDSWRNKTLKFENNSLKEVMQSVATYYDVTLLWPPSLKDDQCKINTTFQNESMANVLKELEIISGLKYDLTKKNILIVKSYKC